MEGAPSGLVAEPRKMDTRATAKIRAMVGAFILRKLSAQASFTAEPGILCSRMVSRATTMKKVPGT